MDLFYSCVGVARRRHCYPRNNIHSLMELKDSLMELKDSLTEFKASLMEFKASLMELKDSLMELKDSLMELKDSFTSIKGALRFRANTPEDYDRFIIAISTTGVAEASPTLQAIVPSI